MKLSAVAQTIPTLGAVFSVAIAMSAFLSGYARADQRPVTLPSDFGAPPGQLVTGKGIVAADSSVTSIGSLPMNMILSPDGKYAITTDMGFRQMLWTLRVSDGSGVDHLEFSNHVSRAASTRAGEALDTRTQPGSPQSNGLYYGLAMQPDGTLFAAQGNHDSVAVLAVDSDGKLSRRREIPTRRNDFPAGLALDDHGHLFVANNSSGGDDPLQMPGSVAIYDAAAGKELGRCSFRQSYGGTSNFPLAITVLRDGSRAYVACERDDAVYVLDTSDVTAPRAIATLATGSRPVAVLLSADQTRLFVANSESDTVSAIDISANRIVGTGLLRPQAVRSLPGATPVGLALSPNGKTLYAALADMNAIGVIDAATLDVTGYIPVGWYPSAVLATPDGKRLLVSDAKGSKAMNPNGMFEPVPDSKRTRHPNILNLLDGDVRTVPVPDTDSLQKLTTEALAQNRIPSVAEPPLNPLAGIDLKSGKITHVIYIIKENRTYDQVMADNPRGNGDPSLLLFGKDVTPNQHALADRFVMLDNVYCCGEVSGDGWNWSTQGMANAYVSRNIPYNYSKRGRKFDFEGQNNGYPTGGIPATGPATRPADADDDGDAAVQATSKPATSPAIAGPLPPIPDIANSGQHLWDIARQAGLSIRNYGFYLYFADEAAGTVGGPDNTPTVPGLMPGGHDLSGITDLDFRRFDLNFPDSDAPAHFAKVTGDASYLYETKVFGRYQASSRFAEWDREFSLMLKKDPSGAAVPALMQVRLPNDHTKGMAAGHHTPRSMVADNDYAVGELVDRVSKSPIWKNTAIVIIEDDAQSGADHIDVHRTTCFVVSPWIKAHSVDHRFYNTDSVLKTIELVLGLGPMTQYDAIAAPIDDWDNRSSNDAPFDAILPDAKLFAETSPKASEVSSTDPRRRLLDLSAAMDFTQEDRAPAQVLNEVIWKSVRGMDSAMPAQRTGKFDARDDDADDK